MALLEAASELLSRRPSLRVVVAHVDHRLREESRCDLALVREEAQERGLRFECCELEPVPAGANLEQWCREQRYEFFLSLRERLQLECIVTAHHRGDCIETFLMRLFSNKDLMNIPRFDPRSARLRPFLHLSKQLLTQFCESRGVPFRSDRSNQDNSFLRNRIRNEILPLLESRIPGNLHSILSDQSARIEAALDALDQLADEAAARVANEPFGSRGWLRSLQTEMEKLPEMVQLRLIGVVFCPILGYPPRGKTAVRLREFVSGSQAGIQCTPGVEIRRRDGGIAVVSPQGGA